MRRRTLARGILSSLLAQWERESAAHEALLDGLGVGEETTTADIMLLNLPIKSDAEFAERLRKNTASSRDTIQYFTLTDGERRVGLALTVSSAVTPQAAPLALYVEIHARLVAWWLTYAWRSRQLSDATTALASAAQTVPAATCARGLLETAAAFWVDARKFAAIWKDAKARGRPSYEQESLAIRQRFVAQLNEVQLGGKFSDRVPETQAVFGHHPRSNVLGAVEKLAKRYAGEVQNDYEWLCNTAHPSLGTALVFSAPPLVHETGTHVQRWFAGVPLSIDGTGPFDDERYVERSIPSATARGAVAALHVLTATLDAALRMLDDIALTTGAPAFADFPYWRAIRPSERNEPCVCRSGRKTKHCTHGWSDPAPTLPETFDPAA